MHKNLKKFDLLYN